jgi:Na+-translocating ferredoxin:NAD+ oxidoreductase RnfA subunit
MVLNMFTSSAADGPICLLLNSLSCCSKRFMDQILWVMEFMFLRECKFNQIIAVFVYFVDLRRELWIKW